VHVVGDLAFHLLLLELDGLVRNSADALRQDLSKSGGLHNIDEYLMALFNESQAESSEANLSDSSVVENLTSDVLQVNALTDVGLEEELSSLVVAPVESMMEGLLQSCLHLHLRRTVLVYEFHQVFNEQS